MTEPLDLGAIKAREAEATEGPWRVEESRKPEYSIILVCGPDDTGEEVIHFMYSDGREPDAEFIASARQDVPALIAEVERLRAIEDAALALYVAIDNAVDYNLTPNEHAAWERLGEIMERPTVWDAPAR